ncbi:MAG: sodC [Labilithrix sp.]|nr:sodC [Labilithrix sp.]
MPEVLSKHPDVALQVLKEQGAQCGVGVRPKILKACPQEKFCVLKGGELCVYGPTELGLMTQLTRNEVCGPVPTPRSEASFGGPALGIGLAFVALAGVAVAARGRRRRAAMRIVPSVVAFFGATAAVASASEPTSREPSDRPSLEVSLEPKSGSSLTGTATFTELRDGVRVVVEVSGIPPGKHGVHVHEKGDCSAPDAKSAGEHFSPDGHPHALPPQEPRHIGDFGNVEVDDDGNGRLEIVAPHANLREGDRRSFRGRAIVVHGKPDDGSQPSGNSGPRIGCGEIPAGATPSTS